MLRRGREGETMSSSPPELARLQDDASVPDYLKQWEATLQGFRAKCLESGPGAIADLRAAVEAFLPEQRADVLLDLVAAQLRASWEHGRGLCLDAYAAEFGNDFPELASPDLVPAELVREEFLARYASPKGDFPPPEEYARRFPGRDDVRALLQARFLDGERYVRLYAREGGMGRVWVAYDRHLRRHVAIKEPKPGLAHDEGILHRLAEEARVTAGLEHPAIVSVHEYRPAGETPFYVMRLVHGRTLRELIHEYHSPAKVLSCGEQRLLWNRLLQVFATVCDAVAYAHERDVLHRDLKPGNIVVGPFGETVVVDWGLAKKVQAGSEPDAESVPNDFLASWDTPANRSGPTPSSAPMGTVLYMAPEQLDGRATVRSDVFGLGAVLYEILTGRAPYQAAGGEDPTAALVPRVRDARIVPPRQACRHLSRSLAAVCLKALARRPEDRYATAAELGNEVRRHLADEPVTAYRESLTDRLGRWSRRNRPIVWTTAALGFAALLALHWQSHKAQRRLDQEHAQLRQHEAEVMERIGKYGVMVTDHPDLKAVGLEQLRRDLLVSVRLYLRRYVEERSQDPTLRAELAAAHRRLSVIAWAGLDDRNEAIAEMEQARALLTSLVEEHPAAVERRRDLAAVCEVLAGLYGTAEDAERVKGAHARDPWPCP
jgi:serine/threonine protein kinase